MEKKKKKSSGTRVKVKKRFSDYALRLFTAIVLIAAAIVALVGICIPDEVTALVGFYLYLVGAIMGIAGCLEVMVAVKIRKAPAYKRSLVGLIVLIVLFALALTGVLLSHLGGFFN